jgi:hypothetical protein
VTLFWQIFDPLPPLVIIGDIVTYYLNVSLWPSYLEMFILYVLILNNFLQTLKNVVYLKNNQN